MGILHSRTTISDEALTKEFYFWKNSFLVSACLAVCAGIATGLLILLWPAGLGSTELRAFVRQLWTAFVECGFWFGFLVGLLWAASRRIGCALGGTVPWAVADQNRMRGFARIFGQAGCIAGFASVLLWLAVSFIHLLNPFGPAVSGLFAQLVYAGWASAGVFILLAVVLSLSTRAR